jgi:hypothetical protein
MDSLNFVKQAWEEKVDSNMEDGGLYNKGVADEDHDEGLIALLDKFFGAIAKQMDENKKAAKPKAAAGGRVQLKETKEETKKKEPSFAAVVGALSDTSALSAMSEAHGEIKITTAFATELAGKIEDSSTEKARDADKGPSFRLAVLRGALNGEHEGLLDTKLTLEKLVNQLMTIDSNPMQVGSVVWALLPGFVKNDEIHAILMARKSGGKRKKSGAASGERAPPKPSAYLTFTRSAGHLAARAKLPPAAVNVWKDMTEEEKAPFQELADAQTEHLEAERIMDKAARTAYCKEACITGGGVDLVVKLASSHQQIQDAIDAAEV